MKRFKKIIFTTCMCSLITSGIVYAAAPSGGYLPGATTNPDCAPGDTDCIVRLVQNADDQTLSLLDTTLSIADGNSVDLAGIDTTKFVDGTNTSDAVYTDGNVGIGKNTPTAKLDVYQGEDGGLILSLMGNDNSGVTARDMNSSDFTGDLAALATRSRGIFFQGVASGNTVWDINGNDGTDGFHITR